MYHPKYLSRHNYPISIERIRQFDHLLPQTFYESQRCCLKVENAMKDDFRFLIQVREQMFIVREEQIGVLTEFDLVRVNEQASFIVIKEITPQNHPWIDKVIPIGTILKGSSNYDYGTVNWLKGIGLETDQACVQINRTSLKLK